MKTKKKVRNTMSKKKDKHITYDDPNNWTYNYAAKQEKDDNEREEMAMSKKSAGSTVNWIKGAVVCTVVLVLVVIFINLLTVRVPAGYAAVQYNMNGGVQDKSLGQGWHIKSPFVKTTCRVHTDFCNLRNSEYSNRGRELYSPACSRSLLNTNNRLGR